MCITVHASVCVYTHIATCLIHRRLSDALPWTSSYTPLCKSVGSSFSPSTNPIYSSLSGGRKATIKFLIQKNVKWEIQSNTCPMRTVRCCLGKPCEGSMPRSLQEFLIIMHLKLVHYYVFKNIFFCPFFSLAL